MQVDSWRSLGGILLGVLVVMSLSGCDSVAPPTQNETLERASEEYCQAEIRCAEQGGLPGDFSVADCLSGLPDSSRYEETHGPACAEALIAYRFCQAAVREGSCTEDLFLSCSFEFAEWTACF